MSKNKLDQFYTKKEIAEMCWLHLNEVISDFSIENPIFLEPSAGKGVFLKLMPDNSIGFDIDPKSKKIEKRDFFVTVMINDDIDRVIVVGNPPFGLRGNLAVSFFNHSAYLASTVAFIVPIIFQKYIIHKKLDPSMKLISTLDLPNDAFETNSGKTRSVNTEFQVWTRLECEYNDLRHSKPMPIVHKDFEMWQYNNTTHALKVFDNDFDFAVPCQGWQDYKRRELSKDDCEKHKQWILLKTKDPITLSRLKSLDYESLAKRCGTSVPGFRKCDLIKEYTDNYE